MLKGTSRFASPHQLHWILIHTHTHPWPPENASRPFHWCAPRTRRPCSFSERNQSRARIQGRRCECDQIACARAPSFVRALEAKMHSRLLLLALTTAVAAAAAAIAAARLALALAESVALREIRRHHGLQLTELLIPKPPVPLSHLASAWPPPPTSTDVGIGAPRRGRRRQWRPLHFAPPSGAATGRLCREPLHQAAQPLDEPARPGGRRGEI